MVRFLWLVCVIYLVGKSISLFGQDAYKPIDTQLQGESPPTALEATRMMTLPPGFQVTLFAGEPDVRQPIAMNFDDRGRLWVAESYSYKEWERKGEDRILIFEDLDNDGVFDTRKVFFDKAMHLSGFALGFGGVWICDSPALRFIPDADGDDVPDGPPEVVLDGFTATGSHNFFNGLKWGPDGWLYGQHGILAPSFVGRPGTPKELRVEMDCGIFRVHPITRAFEVVARGTTNPWGMDWNEMGELFMTGNVNGHLWHVIPGAFYPRMFGAGFYPHVYDRIQSCAGHLHHVGDWRDTRKNHHGVDAPTDALGGGHSHCGGMIYLGDNWPEAYRGSLFMSNTHGRRINQDAIVRLGSGYVAEHRDDFMKANHPWYKGVTQIYGPDGGVYCSDWTDNGECHDNDGVHRTSGRIYKITYGSVENPGNVNLSSLSSSELVALQSHANDWYVRLARRILQERHAEGVDLSRERREMTESLMDVALPVDRRLRHLWALHSTGGLKENELTILLKDESEHIRSWAIRLIGENGNASSAQMDLIQEMAGDGESRLVRLYIASTFPRFSESRKRSLAIRLLSDFGYTEDQNLPQMIWYAIEPLVGADPEWGTRLLSRCADTNVYRNIVRRIASDFTKNADWMPSLVTAIAEAAQSGRNEFAIAGLTGMNLAWEGLKRIDRPENWTLVSESIDSSIAQLAQSIEPAFESSDSMSLDDWMALLDNATRRHQAIRALAEFEDPKIPQRLLKDYARLGIKDREAALETLSSRLSYAQYLIQAMRDGPVSPRDVPAYFARQMLSLGDEDLARSVQEIWGQLRNSPAEKKALIESWQNQLSPERIAAADLENGKRVFNNSCASCHTLFGEGGQLGPDLSGSDRKNLYYILENIIDPGATLPRDYWMTIATLKSGRVVTGTIRDRSAHTLTMLGLTGEEIVPHSEIESLEQIEQSTMPEGILQTLSDEQVRDLVGYLQQN